MGRTKLLFLALIMCTFVGVTAWSGLHYERAYDMAVRHTQLSAWSLAQLELELYQFGTAVDDFRDRRIGRQQLNDAYDMVWNRLDVFLSGSETASVRNRFGAKALIQHLFDQLKASEALVTSPTLQPEQVDPLLAILNDNLPKIRDLMVRNFTGPEAMQENAQLAQSKTLNLSILAALLLVGLTMLVLLFIEARRQHFLVWHDVLTRLPNRAAFIRQLQQSCQRSPQVVLCLMELTRFREVNDSLGHAAGDRLLVMVADELRQMIEAEMFIARTGSDGFAVIIQSVKQDANWFAFSKRLRLTLARLLFDADPAHRVGIRMGVSRAPQHARDSEELLLFADLALLQAREDASQPYQLFSHHLLRQYQRHRQLAEELRAQLSLPTANQLFLCYQPQIPLQPSSRLGAEVLIRWKHPELGFVPPNELVEIAEENGLGEVLCAWILRTLQQDLQTFPPGLVTLLDLAVNLSPSLFHARLPELAVAWLADGPLTVNQLVFELTETIALDDLVRSQQIFADLRQAGIRIALDDFGTGWSSFAYLKDLHFDKLKIDRSFISRIDCEARQALFVQAITELCHRLEVCVVAEGVETAQELAEVQRIHVNEVQGYYFSRPLPANDFMAFASQRLLPARSA